MTVHKYNRPALASAFLALGFLASVACGPPPMGVPDRPGPGGDGQGNEIATKVDTPTPTPAPKEQIPELQFPQNEAFRAEQPKAGEPRPFQLPGVKQFKLKNGMKVYLIENHTLPTISVDMNFDGGSIADPKGKEGLASVCMDMVSEGTEKLDKLAFRAALADTGSSIYSYGAADSVGVGMRTLSKHLEATHALFRDTIMIPGMRQAELDRMVQRRIESLKQKKSTPRSVAQRVSRTMFYGSAHPRGRLVTDASYQAIKVADCKKLHKRLVKPKGARLFIVGDMTEAQVRTHFDKGMKGWKGKGARLPRQPKPKSLKGKLFFVNIPGAAQSAVYLGHFGPQRKAKDYMATRMMSAVLGGGFSSRINMNLREDKGYSYGARGGVNYNRDYGVVYMASSVRSDSTYQTVKEMMQEMKGIQSGAKPATAAELSREKNGAILGLPASFATARQALGRYRNLVYYGLPMDYYNTFVDKVAKVSLEQVGAAAKKHLTPNDAMVLVVGDANAELIVRNGAKDEPLMKDGKPVTLRAGLEQLVASGELGAGKLVELDVDAKIVGK